MICGITKNYFKREQCYLENDISNVSKVCDLKKIEWNGFWARNCEFIGNDIDSIKYESSVECSKSCDSNLKCTHYTYNNGTCHLKRGPIAKSNAVPLSFSTNSVCGLTYFNDKWSICGYDETEGVNNGVYSICDVNKIKWIDDHYSFACDLPGNDFLIVRNVSESSKCFTICDKLRNCTHFVWNLDTCYLKSGTFSKTSAKFIPDNLYSICGFANDKSKLDYCLIEDLTKLKEASIKCDRVLNSVSWNRDWALGCDYDNKNDFLRVKTKSGSKCAAKCKKTVGCSHYVWSPVSGGQCTLKKGLVEKEDARISDDYRLNCGIINRDILYENCALNTFNPSSINYNNGRIVCNKLDLFLNTDHSRLPTCLGNNLFVF